MSSLIKNELIKIFHKKAIYVVLVITLCFMVLISVLNKIYGEDDYSYLEVMLDYYEEEIANLDKNNSEDKEYYIDCEVNIEIIQLELKYGEGSWQAYILESEGYDLLYNVKSSEGTEQYEQYEEQYNDLIYKLEKDDWEYFAQEELNSVNEEIEMLEESQESEDSYLERLKISKQALEWRLEKNISYESSNRNDFLNEWENGKYELYQFEEESKTITFTYSEKYQNQMTEALTNVTEYAIVNGVSDNITYENVNDTYILSSEADACLINVFSDYSIFILIAILIIAGTIVSDEFNKGTIKLLLVKPYNRTKILLAKFITCLIILVMLFAVVALMQTIIGGIVYGFGDYTGQIMVYDFNNDCIQSVGIVQYLLLTAGGVLPMFVLLMTLSFTLSTLFNNSPIAIGIPLIGTMCSEMINELAFYYDKAKFLLYFVTPNWDWTVYLFGRSAQMDALSLPFSVFICVIYFAVMLFASFFKFKKKDIKNS